jgi:hypothetical protein
MTDLLTEGDDSVTLMSYLKVGAHAGGAEQVVYCSHLTSMQHCKICCAALR